MADEFADDCDFQQFFEGSCFNEKDVVKELSLAELQGVQQPAVFLGEDPLVGNTVTYGSDIILNLNDMVVIPDMGIAPPSPGFPPTPEMGSAGKRTGRKTSVEPRTYDSSEDSSPSPAPNLRNTRGRQKRAASTSSAATEVVSQDKRKKPKLHESDDPKAKNARAAKLNREKKKQAMDELQKTNEKMELDLKETSETLTVVRAEKEALSKRVQELETNQRAMVGLQRIIYPASQILESIMPVLLGKHGIGKIVYPTWFNNVEMNTVVPVTGEGQVLATPTSQTVTFHIDLADKSLALDYRPDGPVLSDTIPK